MRPPSAPPAPRLRALNIPAMAGRRSPPIFAHTPTTNPSTTTPAVSTPHTTNPQAPVPGANSFTEGQAKSRIEPNGYANVSGLQKDASGIWRGRAEKGGKQFEVSLDFQGNLVSK